MATKTKNVNMLEGSLFFNLLKFALPLVLTGILQRLYHAADIVVVGRYAGADALAAVGASGSLTTLILDLFTGLSIGVSVVLGRALGAKNKEDAQKTVHTAMLISVFGGILISVFGIVFAAPLLRMIEVPADIMAQAKLYMQIVFAGKVPVLIYTFGSAIVRAKGDTKRPLYIITISGIINVVLNLFFVIVCKMRAEGVAVATVISQIFTAVAILYVLISDEDETKLSFKKLRIHKTQLLEIMRIGLPAGIQSSIFSVSNVIVQANVNAFGSVVLAGNTASANIGGFYYIMFHSLQQSALAFVSQNIGAKNYDRIGKILKNSFALVGIFEVIICLVSFTLGENLLKIYIPDDAAALAVGIKRLYLVGCCYGFNGLMSVMIGVLRGMGYSVSTMVMNIIGSCAIRILWIFTAFEAVKKLEVLYLSYPISWISAFIGLIILYFFAKRKLDKNAESAPPVA
ncbi:MAG: MATE family efflux transporter [Oscillospiraceae bacterium]|nr:MATE family efflux transporter [Oscillospiraceae bacterium]